MPASGSGPHMPDGNLKRQDGALSQVACHSSSPSIRTIAAGRTA
jgi:hypothetical protein